MGLSNWIIKKACRSRKRLAVGVIYSRGARDFGSFAEVFKKELGTNKKRAHRLTDLAEERVRSQLDLLEVGGIHGLGCSWNACSPDHILKDIHEQSKQEHPLHWSGLIPLEGLVIS